MIGREDDYGVVVESQSIEFDDDFSEGVINAANESVVALDGLLISFWPQMSNRPAGSILRVFDDVREPAKEI
ncbi:MAG: hypothetical protein M2R45_02339 [Verrucomicrobia subdivision 3 bacterium]|nr:hypothetical protein [Limisphaerales bacterium]MCS1414891.1 hypothetical protein [Limisphaerales bacterium]